MLWRDVRSGLRVSPTKLGYFLISAAICFALASYMLAAKSFTRIISSYRGLQGLQNISAFLFSDRCQTNHFFFGPYDSLEQILCKCQPIRYMVLDLNWSAYAACLICTSGWSSRLFFTNLLGCNSSFVCCLLESDWNLKLKLKLKLKFLGCIPRNTICFLGKNFILNARWNLLMLCMLG